MSTRYLGYLSVRNERLSAAYLPLSKLLYSTEQKRMKRNASTSISGILANDAQVVPD